MLTSKDLEFRTICVVNCMAGRKMRVCNGELLLEDTAEGRVLTKLPFQKVLAIFAVGDISVTTPLLEKCRRYGTSLFVVKPTFRPVFVWANTAEANFLLRQRQLLLDKDDISVAKVLVQNKMRNQLKLLRTLREKDGKLDLARRRCAEAIEMVPLIGDYRRLLAAEGRTAKCFFSSYFRPLGWVARKPRLKADAINTALDLGYTILFNFVECFARMFGFDVYVGVYHRLFFNRKSLVCDLMEPFRCIIDRRVRLAFMKKQCSEDDFVLSGGRYQLRYERIGFYCQLFFDSLVPYKMQIFRYVQAYYRCFVRNSDPGRYPEFLI